MKDLTMAIDNYLPLRDVVFITLREAILKGELEPGERLMEIALAQKLGVSRTPIREAIRKLELEGLVVMAPRKGAEVAEITLKDLRDVLEVRKNLEELAVELACKKATENDIEEMKLAHEEFIKTLSQKDLTVIAEADVKFHDVIYRTTGNKRLIQILNNLREQMYRYRLEYIKDEKKRMIVTDEHLQIIEAIRNKDVNSAKDYIQVHINNQEKTIVEKINAKKAEKDK
ncbi:MAG: GntR family transcriptional regulator [Lachnospiraceae bacterium]|nr:GntR family transcriptional regulator [Lachnospiraceae bacterium]